MNLDYEPTSRRNKKSHLALLIFTILCTSLYLYLSHLPTEVIKTTKQTGFLTFNLDLASPLQLLQESEKLIDKLLILSTNNQEALPSKEQLLLTGLVKTNNFRLRVENVKNTILRILVTSDPEKQLKDYLTKSKGLPFPTPTEGAFFHTKPRQELKDIFVHLSDLTLSMNDDFDKQKQVQTELTNFFNKLSLENTFNYQVIIDAIFHQKITQQSLDHEAYNRDLKTYPEKFRHFLKTLEDPDIYKQELFYAFHNNIFSMRIPVFEPCT